MRLERCVTVGVPAAEAWAYVTDWTRHHEWVPLSRAEGVGGEGHAVGGRLRAWTGLGPVGVWDSMTITRWDEHPDGSGHFAVVHTGRVVRGDAEVEVVADGPSRATVRWVEDLRLPRVTAPIAGALLGMALKRLKARLG